MFIKQTILLFIIVFSATSLVAEQGLSKNYEEEQILRLIQSHSQEGIVWLGSPGNNFLTLYRESGDPGASRAVIILHSMGMHADWPELISPLRLQLPTQGWATLSVQLPLLDPGFGFAEYGGTFPLANDRIRSSIIYLQDRGYRDIFIIGYGFGATVAVNYLVSQRSVIKAMVGLSMQNHPFLKPKYDLIDELSKITIPVLDIQGGQDFSGVLKSTDDRRLAANKAGNTAFKQLIIKGANHSYTGKEDELVYAITEWLNRLVSGDRE